MTSKLPILATSVLLMTGHMSHAKEPEIVQAVRENPGMAIGTGLGAAGGGAPGALVGAGVGTIFDNTSKELQKFFKKIKIKL